MKRDIVICGLILQAILFSISYQATGQNSDSRSYEEKASKEQQRDDARNLSDLKSKKQDTRAKARDAQRVGNEANNAAKQSKLAYRQEKKAQNARNRADKQQKKAIKARAKSDEN